MLRRRAIRSRWVDRPVVLVGNGDVVALYTTSLRRAGFRVVGSDDAGGALYLVTVARPRACVIDLPSLRDGGWTICETIRERPSLKHVPILVLAEGVRRIPRAAQKRARRLDCTIVAKPVDPDELVACVALFVGCCA